MDGADDYLKEAKGVLIIPSAKKIGFVMAAQWGVGALQVNGRSVGYYRMDAASAGFQAGFQQNNFVFIPRMPSINSAAARDGRLAPGSQQTRSRARTPWPVLPLAGKA